MQKILAGYSFFLKKYFTHFDLTLWILVKEIQPVFITGHTGQLVHQFDSSNFVIDHMTDNRVLFLFLVMSYQWCHEGCSIAWKEGVYWQKNWPLFAFIFQLDSVS